jgi:CBS-domain-containing membrane protein
VLARDLAEPYPTVRLSTPATDAALLLADRKLPGLIVVDDHDHPVAILPGSQLLRRIIPAYVREDPALARVMDEESSDHLCDAIAERTVQDILPREKSVLPLVLADDTGIEIAAIMANARSPIVAVVEDESETATLIGAVSVAHLLEMLLPPRVRQP